MGDTSSGRRKFRRVLLKLSGEALREPGNTDNISNYSLPLSLCPVTGLDELSITVR